MESLDLEPGDPCAAWSPLADALTVEKLGERAFRFEVVEPGGWPLGGPALSSMDLKELDRGYVARSAAPRPRPAAALRSLSALMRAWEHRLGGGG